VVAGGRESSVVWYKYIYICCKATLDDDDDDDDDDPASTNVWMCVCVCVCVCVVVRIHGDTIRRTHPFPLISCLLPLWNGCVEKLEIYMLPFAIPGGRPLIITTPKGITMEEGNSATRVCVPVCVFRFKK